MKEENELMGARAETAPGSTLYSSPEDGLRGAASIPRAGDSAFGAAFSECRKYRYALWRIWDRSKPLVMFVGLNPSTANEVDADPTIRSVGRLAKANGFGGFYMMNCFPFVSTDPQQLRDHGNTALNDHWLYTISRKCETVLFAWGAFAIVRELGRDVELSGMFPNAKALHINRDGSPKHPLYCKSDTVFVPWILRVRDRNEEPGAGNPARIRSEEPGGVITATPK